MGLKMSMKCVIRVKLQWNSSVLNYETNTLHTDMYTVAENVRPMYTQLYSLQKFIRVCKEDAWKQMIFIDPVLYILLYIVYIIPYCTRTYCNLLLNVHLENVIYIHTYIYTHTCIYIYIYIYIYSMAQQPLVGHGLLTIEVSRSHSDTPHSVGFLWTSDQPDAEISTWQLTTLTKYSHPWLRRDSNRQS
jgi:hypothetical protein